MVGLKARAILLSLALHLVPFFLLLFFFSRTTVVKEEPAAEDRFVIEAPLGNVFVLKATGGDAKLPGESTSVVTNEPIENGTQASPNPGTPMGEAVPLGKIEPVYPSASRRLGEQGESVFVVGIEADGSVSAAQLEKSSGHARLDAAAKEALLTARFQPPAHSDGVGARKRFRVEFRLEGGAKP